MRVAKTDEPIIDDEFKKLIPPLSAKTYKELADSIENEGFDIGFPLITWNGILIDGHNRLALCKKYKLKYTTVEKKLKSREEVILWIIKRSLQRRQLKPKQIKALRALRYEREKHPHGGARKPSMQNEDLKKTSEVVADDEGVNPSTIQRSVGWLRAAQEIAKNTDIDLYELIDKKITDKDMLDISNQSPEIQKKVIAKINSKEVKDSKSAIKAVEKEESIVISAIVIQGKPQSTQPKNTRYDFYNYVTEFMKVNPENETAKLVANVLKLEEGAILSSEAKKEAINNLDKHVSTLRKYIAEIINKLKEEKQEEPQKLTTPEVVPEPEASPEPKLEPQSIPVEKKNGRNDYTQYDLPILELTTWKRYKAGAIRDKILPERKDKDSISIIVMRCRSLVKAGYLEANGEKNDMYYIATKGAIERYVKEHKPKKTRTKSNNVIS